MVTDDITNLSVSLDSMFITCPDDVVLMEHNDRRRRDFPSMDATIPILSCILYLMLRRERKLKPEAKEGSGRAVKVNFYAHDKREGHQFLHQQTGECQAQKNYPKIAHPIRQVSENCKCVVHTRAHI